MTKVYAMRLCVTAMALACVSTGSAQQPIELVRLAEAARPSVTTVQSNRLLNPAGWTPMLVPAGLLTLAAAILVGMRRRSRDLDVV